MAAVWFQIVLGPVELVDEIDSTNAELLRRARSGAPEGAVLVAAHQTAGRGRLDRQWEAPPGTSLLVSVLLRPPIPVERMHLVAFAAGLAALDACSAIGVSAGLKWPNDIVVPSGGRDHKLAGLLSESFFTADRLDALVVGMGLNVNWPGPLPADGVALNQLVDHEVDLSEVLDRWLRSFERWYAEVLTPEGRHRVLDAYRLASATIGSQVRVEGPAQVVVGDAVDVDDVGRLLVRCPELRTFAVGDVVHLRPSID